MDKVLLNIALFTLSDFCKSRGLDISGSHVEKVGRGFRFRLIRDATGEQIANVVFSKNARPHLSYRA